MNQYSQEHIRPLWAPDIAIHANKKDMKSNPKTPSDKKGVAKKLKKSRDENELKPKWTAKASVVLVLMRIKF